MPALQHKERVEIVDPFAKISFEHQPRRAADDLKIEAMRLRPLVHVREELRMWLEIL